MDNETNYIEEQVLVCESVDELKEIIPMVDGLGSSFKEAEKIVHRQNA